MLHTPLCDMLGIRYPILSAGFGSGAGPELAAAVSNAGGCGVLGASGQGASSLRGRIRRARELTGRPIGANVIIADVNDLRDENIGICTEEHVPLLVLFWGDPAPYVVAAHRAGAKVFIQVGSVDEATIAAAAGVDGIIAQGIEAGGHVRGTMPLSVLLPAVVHAVKPLPVLAAGGIADGKGLVAAVALGAQGVSMGTRFVASREAFIRQEYKQRIVESHAEDTVYGELFDLGWPHAPHRTLRNKVVKEWEAAGRPPSGQRPGEGTMIGRITTSEGETEEVPRYYGWFSPTPRFEGDIEYAPLWAGESCGQVNDIKPAGQIVQDIVRDAEAAIAELNKLSAAD